MIVCLGLVMNALLVSGAWWVAGRLVYRSGWIARVLACAVLAQAWVVVGLQVLGPWGWLSIGPLTLWSAALFLTGLAIRSVSSSDSPPAAVHGGVSEAWGIETIVSAALVIWTMAYLGTQSLLFPVKVVSDGPIYHLYFAARWWKAERLFLVASPFGESAATYFPANGDLWFTWLMVSWQGDRLARVGQAPCLLMAMLAAFSLARRTGSGRNSSLLATCWFVSSTPLLLFSFEANVDTIFAASYLTAAYFFLVYIQRDAGPSALALGGLAAGFSLGTKSIGLVFIPLLLVLAFLAIASRRRDLREILGASLLVLACVLIPSGFWFGRNLVLTGNPLYPLRVEILGTTILQGWYDRGAMRFSQYYVPIDNWRALGDTLLAVVDPRMAPVWMASLAGAWALGRGGKREGVRWVWVLSGLAALNIAFYWIFIPYRTQQRFMLQGLGLAAAPLAKLFDRGRWLRTLAAVLLAMHLLTPQAWPFAARESEIPWDLTVMIPNAVSPPLPLMAQVLGAFRTGGPAAGAGLGTFLLMGGFAGLAVWGVSRFSGAGRRGPTIAALVGATGLLFACALDSGALEKRDAVYSFYPPFRDYYAGWLDLEGRSGPSGVRVAYAGTNIPYYLFGAGLRNEVRYVNIDGHRDWLMHNYHEQAAARGDATWPNSRPGWDRLHPDYDSWLANLKAEDIQLLVVTRVNPEEGPHNVADKEGFPVERRWADAHPESFELLYGPRQNDRLYRLYRFRPQSFPRKQ